MAELLEERGDLEGALGYFESFGQIPRLTEAVLYALAQPRIAAIHERLGNTERAVAHYETFIELWKECDPELRPQVEDARARLAALLSGQGDR